MSGEKNPRTAFRRYKMDTNSTEPDSVTYAVESLATFWERVSATTTV